MGWVIKQFGQGGGLKRQNFQKKNLHPVISYKTTVISTCSFVGHDYIPPLPVGVPAAVVDRHMAHKHDAAWSPLCRLRLGEADVDGSAALRPGPAMLVWVWKAHRTWLAVV